MIEPATAAYGFPPAAPEQTTGVIGRWPPELPGDGVLRLQGSGSRHNGANGPSWHGGTNPDPALERTPRGMDSGQSSLGHGDTRQEVSDPAKSPPKTTAKAQPGPNTHGYCVVRPQPAPDP